eukprot:TRINITY_DN4836_c0_g2_i1.p2 TRINITY_DN4836_c0_g2~~TRINITY_DN4836_c0_g2_i1.p2  ORF type:complete len:174 (+),score=33.48 TRINITY_DN4836_c0_g2_i1:502-1023(+)
MASGWLVCFFKGVCVESGRDVFVEFVDRWVAAAEEVGEQYDKKLYALAMCEVLGVEHAALARPQRVAALLTAVSNVLVYIERVGVGFENFVMHEQDGGGAKEESALVQSQRRVYMADAVYQRDLRKACLARFAMCRRNYGASFDEAVNSLHPSIVQALKAPLPQVAATNTFKS